MQKLGILALLAGLLALGLAFAWNHTQRNAPSPEPEPEPSPPISSNQIAPSTTAANAAKPGRQPVAGPRAAPTPTGATRRLRGRLLQRDAPLARVDVQLWQHSGTVTPHRLTRVAETTTDRTGAFTVSFAAPPAANQRFMLAAIGPTVPTRWHVPSMPRPARDDYDLGDLAVPSGGTIRGRLVDAQGAPVAAVRVAIAGALNRTRLAFAPRDAGAEATPWHPPVQRTDADGVFVFEGLPPGKHRVLTDGRDHLATSQDAELGAGETLDVGALLVKRGRVATGRVLDDAQQPIAGATVAPQARYGRVDGHLAVTTDERGAFHVRGMARRARLRISAAGFLAEDLEVPAPLDAPLLVKLERTVTLRGHVTGHRGAPTRIEMGTDIVAQQRMTNFPRDAAVAENGTFVIHGLAPARYWVRAIVRGVGRSKRATVQLTRQTTPLPLVIEPFPTLRVTVRDDTGQPVVGARLVIDERAARFPNIYADGAPGLAARILSGHRAATGSRPTTNQRGAAVVPYPASLRLAIAAAHRDHLAGARVFTAGAVPEAAEIIMTRAAQITGRVDDAAARTQCRMSVLLRELATEHNRLAGVDAQGRFSLDHLPPGRYELALHYAHEHRADVPHRTKRTPMLGGADARVVLPIALAPGEQRQLALEVPPLGTISGVVLQRGAPVAGAVVVPDPVDQPENAPLRFSAAPDHPTRHKNRPHAITAADGAFHFAYVNPGAWDLYVRHPTGPATMAPVRVRAAQPAQRIEVDLVLGAAAVRGTIDQQPLAAAERTDAKAYLFRLERSASDAFHWPHHGLSEAASMLGMPLLADGHFAFDHLPAGQWVLRVATRGKSTTGESVWLQRRITTQRDEVIDLGVLRRPQTHDVQLPLALPRAAADDPWHQGHGVWVRDAHGDVPNGVFRATYPVEHDQLIVRLPPGAYRVELFEQANTIGAGLCGKSTLRVRDLTVHADGSTEPAVLDFRDR